MKLLEEGSRNPETKHVVLPYALALYRKGQVEKALEVIDNSNQPENRPLQIVRTYVMAEHPAYGPEKAYESFLENNERQKRKWERDPAAPWFDTTVQLFFGKKAEVVREHSSAVAPLFRLTPPANVIPFSDYITGKKSEKEFLDSAKDDRMSLCGNEYLVAMTKLAEGDRDGAKQHFQKAIDTKWIYHVYGYPYSQAFLERLKKDPTWPKWIPVKK
jgi:hypothetical protein